MIKKANNIFNFWEGLSKETCNYILKTYSLVPAPVDIIYEHIPFIGNRVSLMYKLPKGYAIYSIVGYKKYKLEEIIGEVPEELLKGLNHDANHRVWVSKTYNTKTPVLPYDKGK